MPVFQLVVKEADCGCGTQCHSETNVSEASVGGWLRLRRFLKIAPQATAAVAPANPFAELGSLFTHSSEHSRDSSINSQALKSFGIITPLLKERQHLFCPNRFRCKFCA